jgi:hypothetical protein
MLRNEILLAQPRAEITQLGDDSYPRQVLECELKADPSWQVVARKERSRMEKRSIKGLTLFFDAKEQEAAELVGDACEQSVGLIHRLWGLAMPADCRVYVMTSWPSFLFHSAPWPWRIWLGTTMPLRQARLQKLWELAGGWTQCYGHRRTIGVKPPRLLQAADSGIRERIFVPRKVEEWVQHNTCHELVHAFAGHLRLPTWLHEGLAMVTVDHLAGRPTVKSETIETLAQRAIGSGPTEGYGRQSVDPERLIYLAVRGYWVTRYLADTRPALLTKLLERRLPHDLLEGTLAVELGMDQRLFWSRIDAIVVSHFRGQEQKTPPMSTRTARGDAV